MAISPGEAWERRVGSEGVTALPVWVKVPNDRTVGGAQRGGSVWLDYMGCDERGRMVTGDAKWVGSKRHVTASILKPAQRVHADRALEAGAVVVVVVGGLWGSACVSWAQLREGRVEFQEGSSWLADLAGLLAAPERVGRETLEVIGELEAIARDVDAPAAARVRALELLGKASGTLDAAPPRDARWASCVLKHLPTEALRAAEASALAELDRGR